MAVALVSTWETDCGIATYTRALREGLVASGVEADVVAIDRREVKYLARKELRPYFDALAERTAGYDLVHVQHEYGIFGGATHSLPVSVSVTSHFLSRLARHGVPVVTTFHTEPLDLFGPPVNPWALVMGAAQRAHFHAAMALAFRRHPNLRAIVHTRSSRRAFLDAGLPAGAVDVVPHGMHVPDGPLPGEEARRAARERVGLPPDAVVLAQFGFLAGYKGIPTSVRALHELPDRFRLAVLGDSHPHGGDDTLERLLGAAREPRDGGRGGGVEHRIDLPGYIPAEDLADWRLAASIGLAPYRPVPGFSFSGALTWAFGAGVPIVASRVGPFVELQEDAGCLELVAPDAPRELAYRVARLEADPARAERLALAARAHAERFSWERVAERHAELYARSCDHAAASRTSAWTSWRSARSASRTNGSPTSHGGASESRSASALR